MLWFYLEYESCGSICSYEAYSQSLSLSAKLGKIFHDMDSSQDYFIVPLEVSAFFAKFDEQYGTYN